MQKVTTQMLCDRAVSLLENGTVSACEVRTCIRAPVAAERNDQRLIFILQFRHIASTSAMIWLF